MTELYLETTPPKVEKLGFEAKLSTNADTWPHEVLAELFRQCPFVGNYDINPVMTEVDGDAGFGIGFFQIRSGTATESLGAGGTSLQALRGVRSAKIPIVIRGGKLAPLDVFMDMKGRAYPLSESRLSSILFRPEVADGMGTPPRSVSMVDSLYPPNERQRLSNTTEVYKSGSAKGSIIDQILHTVTQGALDQMRGELEKEASLLRYMISNETTRPVLEKLSSLHPLSANDVARLSLRSLQPDVVQVVRLGNSYVVKMAQSDAFAPETTPEMDRVTTEDIAGPDLVSEADQEGYATVSADPVVHEVMEDETVAKIDRFGQYRVKTVEGKELLGWVFPIVLDFNGVAVPMTLFTNGSDSSIQEKIVGSPAGSNTNIIRAEPKGSGFFYRVTADGSVVAFVPVNVQSGFSTPEGSGLLVTTLLGEQYKAIFVPGLQEIMQMGPNQVGLPGDLRWAPLSDNVIPLVDTPEAFSKLASLKSYDSTVIVRSDGSCWSFMGKPVQKLAEQWRANINRSDAAFVASIIGMSPKLANRVLDAAALRGHETVRGCRGIRTVKEKVAGHKEAISTLWNKLPRSPHLLKEAAVLTDTDTVDAVLSLGFLNPENISIFVSFLPDFDMVVSKLAALLVAARVGLDDVPEESVKSSMERLEEVIAGLRKLVYTQT